MSNELLLLFIALIICQSLTRIAHKSLKTRVRPRPWPYRSPFHLILVPPLRKLAYNFDIIVVHRPMKITTCFYLF